MSREAHISPSRPVRHKLVERGLGEPSVLPAQLTSIRVNGQAMERILGSSSTTCKLSDFARPSRLCRARTCCARTRRPRVLSLLALLKVSSRALRLVCELVVCEEVAGACRCCRIQ